MFTADTNAKLIYFFICAGKHLQDQISQALVACNEPKQASALLIKKYITEYHPNLGVEERPHLLRNALERASSKGVIRCVHF